MDLHLLRLVACIGSLLIQLPMQALPASVSAPTIPVSDQLSAEQLRKYAQSITVKVLSGDTWGSGILIHRKGQVYTVLTNQHVLTPGEGKPYHVQTPDGLIYQATVSRVAEFEGNDLGLLQFSSSEEAYTVASLGTLTLFKGDEVFAAGFPFEAKGFVFTTGQISLLLDKALDGGYQIGYTNDIQKGMSGGPLLNRRGQVVGINGRHAYPLWGNPYVFKDGSVPTVATQEQMSHFSWAVPVQTFLQVAPQFSTGEAVRS